MNYVMSGWPGRDPPRGGSEGPAPMVDRAPVRGPAGPGKGRWFGSVFHRTLPAGVGLLRVRRQGHHPPRGVAGCRCDLRHRIDGHCPPGVCGGGPTGPAGVVAYTRDATTPPPGVVEAPVPSTVLLFHISEHMHICTHEKKERRLP